MSYRDIVPNCHHRKAMSSASDCSAKHCFHPVVSKKEMCKAFFISSFSPEITTVDVDKSLKEQSSLKKLVCTRLKTNLNSYAHFRVLSMEIPSF
jgi:hypothetical protein